MVIQQYFVLPVRMVKFQNWVLLLVPVSVAKVTTVQLVVFPRQKSTAAVVRTVKLSVWDLQIAVGCVHRAIIAPVMVHPLIQHGKYNKKKRRQKTVLCV